MSEQFVTAISRASSAGFFGQETTVSNLRSPRRNLARAQEEVVGCSNSAREIEYRSSKAIACDQVAAFSIIS
jgi:hypothetical protein